MIQHSPCGSAPRAKRFIVLAVLLALSACAAPGGRQNQTFSPEVSRTPVSDDVQRRADAVYEVLLAEFSGRDGDFDAAADHYANASDLTDDPGVAEHAARVALYAKDYDSAERAVQRWRALSPNDVSASEFTAVVALRRGEIQQAAEVLDELIVNSSADEPYEIVEKVIYSSRDTAQQYELAAEMRNRHRDKVVIQRIFARIALRQSRHDEALQATEDAIRLDGIDARNIKLRSQILLAKGEVDQALSDVRQLHLANPDDHELTVDYARMLVQARQYEKALELFLRALVHNPDDHSLRYSVAILEYELERWPEAVVHLEKLLDSEQHRDEANYYLGRIYDTTPEKAIAFYSSVRGGEYFLEAQVRVADGLARLGQSDAARAHLNRIRDSQNNDALAIRLYMAETRLLREQERFDEALSVFDTALEQFPDNIDLLYSRAMTGEQAGDLSILERDLRRILKQQPDNAMAMNALGYTLADQTDRLQEAHDLIAKALSLEPEDAAIIDSMGWVLYRMGDYAQAEKYLRKAFAKSTDAEIAEHLALVQIALGRSLQARETLRKALMSDPQNTALLELERSLAAETPTPVE